MNQILEWLSGGDLRSDGLSGEVAEFVLNNPELVPDLFEGLFQREDIIRGRSADALEKVARIRPDCVEPYITELAVVVRSEKRMVVKLHLAMLFGDLAMYQENSAEMCEVLLKLLSDKYIFVQSWAISSLCVYARMYPEWKDLIIERVSPLQNSNSPAIRSRVRNALEILLNPSQPFPAGWIKSEHLRDL